MAVRSQSTRTRVREATVVDVARRAKVALGTVSRVINRHPTVTRDMRERVLVACRELGFMPRTTHRSIGVVVDLKFVSPFTYGPAMLGLLMRALAKRDYTMEVIELADLDLAYEAHVEGIIGVTFDEQITKLCSIPNLPILTINQPMIEKGIHSVCTDHFQQGVLATDHLLAHGHRTIAFLENQPNNWGSQQRMAGYRASLEKAGVPFDPRFVCYANGDTLYAPLNRVISQGATALVNFSEDYELEAIHILTHILKLSIPGDISVVTMENMPVFNYLTPPQTVIRQPLDELARAAVEELLKLCQERKSLGRKRTKTSNIVLPCELVERESVAVRRNAKQEGVKS